MFVTLIRADQLPGQGKDDVVQALNEMASDLRGEDVPGFKQAYLLRGEKRNAMAIALWESAQHAEAYMASEPGKKAAKKQEKAFGAKAPKERYQVTWQAKFGDEVDGPRSREAMADLSGHWEGTLLDTEGIQQRANLEIDETAEAVEGTAGLTVIDTHERSAKKGKVTGPKGGAGTGALATEETVEFTIRLETGGEFKFRGWSGEPGEHAEAVVYGTYSVIEKGDLPVSAGVAILWRYRRTGA